MNCITPVVVLVPVSFRKNVAVPVVDLRRMEVPLMSNCADGERLLMPTRPVEAIYRAFELFTVRQLIPPLPMMFVVLFDTPKPYHGRRLDTE